MIFKKCFLSGILSCFVFLGFCQSYEFVNQELTEILYGISIVENQSIIGDDTVTGKGSFRFYGSDFQQAFDSFLNANRLYVDKSKETWVVSKIRLIEEEGKYQFDCYDVSLEKIFEFLSEKSQFFDSIDGALYEYIGDSGIDAEKPILLYVSDLFCYSKDFSPVLAGYAREGYQVFAADLFLDDVEYNSKFLDNKLIRPFALRMQKVYNNSKFEKNLDVYIQKKEREIKSVKDFLEKKYPNKEILFLGDSYTSQAVKNLFFKENIIKYDWGGCGLLSQTLPLEYKVLLSKDKKN